MKITLLTIDLKKALGVVIRGISSKPHLPILTGMLLKVKDNKVSIESTDLEMSFWVNVPASVEEEGVLVIPAKLFGDLILSLSGEKVELTSEGVKLKIKTKGVSSEIVCQNVDDFPVIPRSVKPEIRIETSLFKKKHEKINVSVAKEDTRPILTGVLWQFEKDNVNLVATDGFRLGVERMALLGGGNDLSGKRYVIPSRSLLEVSKTAGDFGVSNFAVEVDEKSKQIVFVLGDVEISSRLLEGEFPPYQQIIPNTYNTKMSLLRDELLSAVKRASLFARDNANVIKVKVDEREVLVLAENSQVGSNMTNVEGEIEGEKITMAFNARYLIDYLSNVEGDYVEWETEGELKPSVFRDTKNESWLQVIMPIRVQG